MLTLNNYLLLRLLIHSINGCLVMEKQVCLRFLLSYLPWQYQLLHGDGLRSTSPELPVFCSNILLRNDGCVLHATFEHD